MKHIGAVSLFTNPIVNSYKRLIPGFDAPIYANWSVKKKSALIRIPFEKEEKMDRVKESGCIRKSIFGTRSLSGGRNGWN